MVEAAGGLQAPSPPRIEGPGPAKNWLQGGMAPVIALLALIQAMISSREIHKGLLHRPGGHLRLLLRWLQRKADG